MMCFVLFQLTGHNDMLISDLVADVVMEYRLSSYRVHLASSKAILQLDMEAGMVDNSTIQLVDAEEDGLSAGKPAS